MFKMGITIKRINYNRNHQVFYLFFIFFYMDHHRPTNRSTMTIKNAPSLHLRQMRAVGIVTQTGAYFFLASGVPRCGSSATDTFTTDHTAAAAAANTRSLLPALLLLLFSLLSFLKLTLSLTFEALAIITPRLRPPWPVVEGGLVVATLWKEAAVIVMEAISFLYRLVWFVFVF
ncbi:unnamed protein product [Camellia sinensis]